MIEMNMVAKKAKKIQKKVSNIKPSAQKSKKPQNAKSKVVKAQQIVKGVKAKSNTLATAKKSPTSAKPSLSKSASSKSGPVKKIEAKLITRAPVRKVIGSDRSLTIVEPRVLTEQIVVDDRKVSIEEPIIAPVVTVKPVPAIPVATVPIVRVAWTALPKTFPPHIRFFVSMAEKECRSASTWPFPYAKFLSALPVKVCGKAFAAFLLWGDFDSQEIAKKLSIPSNELEHLVAGEGARMLEYFTETCPDMYRKLATQLGGVGVSIDLLAERYLVTKVDRDFQLMIAAMMLKLMVI